MAKPGIDRGNAACLAEVISNYNRCFQRLLGFSYHYREPKIRYKGKKHEGHYHFIPSTPLAALEYIRAAKEHIYKRHEGRYPELSFLDCGCGVGNIMVLAYHLGFCVVEGIEYDLETRRMARRLVPSCKVRGGDLINFRGYKNYDVLYFYVPIENGGKRRIFLDKIINNAKVGAIIISFGGGGAFYQNERFKRVKYGKRNIPVFEKMK